MPSQSEYAPLLPDRLSISPQSDAPLSKRIISRIKGDGEPTWAASLRALYLGSYINLLLVFIPLAAVAHFSEWDAGLRFGFSFVAIMPLAKLLGDATEQLSIKLGQTLGGLLNASFGNAVEVIVGVAALLQGQLRIVQTSMLGSILSNLLLVLGMSFFAGGLTHYESKFQVTAAQTSSSLMTLACITLIIPAAYHASVVAERANTLSPALSLLSSTAPSLPSAVSSMRLQDHLPSGDDYGKEGLLVISRGTSVLLLIVYVAFLYFQLGSHTDLFKADDEGEEELPKMNMVSAGVSLLAITLVTSFCADWLVASIEETAEKYSIPTAFIGLILLPLVANAAEHVTSVWMAVKGKMELTITISIGSSIQIAAFVVPLLVIIGWIIDRDLTLFFANFETIALFVSVFLVNLLIQDGKSNYMEGLMLMSLYIVLALAFWVS